MLYRVTLLAAILLVFSASLFAHKRLDDPLQPEVSPFWQCRRIVSMAPSITETLYALGLGDKVVGVTRFCKYPPGVEDKKKIGGYYDPNFEAIVALKPDLIVMLEEHEQSLPGFQKLRLETLVVSHQTLDGIVESFRQIGRVCGRGAEGRRLAREYQNRMERIRSLTRDLPRPRVLMSLDRILSRGHLASIFVVGDDKYFDQIIEIAGGQNAYREVGVRYPVISTEGILRLNPDVIIDLVPPSMAGQLDRQTILGAWKELEQLQAVNNGRVLVFDQGYTCVPGPRFIQLLEELARVLHPEVPWDNTDTTDYAQPEH